MATIAITGATGFAGSCIVGHLVQSGHELKCLVRPKPGRHLDDRPGVEWVKGAITSMADLERLVDGVDVVVHVAALTRALGPDAFHDTNCRATAMLVAAARRAGVQTFFLISSLAASRSGISPYAWSKALAEEAAAVLAGDMKLITLRPPAILGPGDSATRDVMTFLRRGWLVCPGGVGGATFSWIDVDDMAKFVTDLVGAPPRELRTTIAPCSGQDISWHDVAAAAEKVLDRKVRCVGIPSLMVNVIGGLASSAASLTRQPLILSLGKAAELLQPNWHAETVVSAPAPLHRTLSRCFLQLSGRKQTV